MTSTNSVNHSGPYDITPREVGRPIKRLKRTGKEFSAQSNSVTTSVNALWEGAANQQAFSTLWNRSSLEVKRAFVTRLDFVESPSAMERKMICLNIIYQGLMGAQVTRWPRQKDPAYYHATTETNANFILLCRSICVRNNLYDGVFVSTNPELYYGRIVFVFNRSIERLNLLETQIKPDKFKGPTGFFQNMAYWAGFSGEIPVTKDTLVKILIVAEGNRFNLLAGPLREAGWEGLVVEPYQEVAGDSIVPREWPL